MSETRGMTRLPGGRRPRHARALPRFGLGPAVLVGGLALLLWSACLRIGEPSPDTARVTWAAYPETVLVDRVFSFEFAGPVALDTCGRLDTAIVAVGEDEIVLSARRSLFDALCSGERVSYYEARPMSIPAAGRYPVRTAEGLELGTLVALDSGEFSRMRAVGVGTLQDAGGCTVFGAGWASNQRPFALRGLSAPMAMLAGTDTLVRVEGTLVGYSLCGGFGSRPTIRVREARALGRTGSSWYPEDEE